MRAQFLVRDFCGPSDPQDQADPIDFSSASILQPHSKELLQLSIHFITSTLDMSSFLSGLCDGCIVKVFLHVDRKRSFYLMRRSCYLRYFMFSAFNASHNVGSKVNK